jgi:hypothetical protein
MRRTTLFLSACIIVGSPAAAWAGPEDSVVKVLATLRYPNPLKPWTNGTPVDVLGSGTVIDGKRILTNAHLVLYATDVQVQPRRGGSKVEAKVEALAPDMDLALLSVKDDTFFRKCPPLRRTTKLPHVQDAVAVYGFPEGGSDLAVTKGVVSRIDFGAYSQQDMGLIIQVSAAINAGSSGGPAVVDERMIGLVFGRFREGENIGYRPGSAEGSAGPVEGPAEPWAGGRPRGDPRGGVAGGRSTTGVGFIFPARTASATSGGTSSKEERDIRSKATDLLLRHHVASPRLGRVAEMLASSQDKKSTALLRAILAKNPHQEVKAEACVALALQMQARVALIKQYNGDPQAAKSVDQNYGRDYALELQKADLAKSEAEAEKLYAELVEKYLPDMKPPSVALLCQRLHYTADSERLLRALYARGKRHEVRGVACLVLAQVLRGSADEAKCKESEKLFEEAAAKYADVETAFDGTVGRKAQSELFDLRYLPVGKAAPEIQGTDQDGTPFKLSDYKGKVVLLDFWSEF